MPASIAGLVSVSGCGGHELSPLRVVYCCCVKQSCASHGRFAPVRCPGPPPRSRLDARSRRPRAGGGADSLGALRRPLPGMPFDMATTATKNEPKGEAALPRPEPHVLVLFGATGDLARRKLLPGPVPSRPGGADARGLPDRRDVADELDDEEFRAHVRDALDEFCRMRSATTSGSRSATRLSYVPSTGRRARGGRGDARRRRSASEARRAALPLGPAGRRGPMVRTLGEAGLAERARVVMEKPFGTDLESARALNDTVHEVFGRSRSSASTTSSARRRRSTSSRCGSPTASSSRCGTASTSTTCRSTSPRRCRSARAASSTRGPARSATWS